MTQPAPLTLNDLPAVVPVFAVSGALLLPGGRLPLTVFEPRYLALTDDALGAGRLFALVQPTPEHAPHLAGPAPGLFPTGTLARITAFGETGDGRYLITAQGLIRFRLMAEDAERSGYRRVLADYAPFAADLSISPDTPLIDRRRLMTAMAAYLTRQGVPPDLSKLDQASDTDLVTGLAMAAPLSPQEKQALLEAADIGARAQLMTAIFELALLDEAGPVRLH